MTMALLSVSSRESNPPPPLAAQRGTCINRIKRRLNGRSVTPAVLAGV